MHEQATGEGLKRRHSQSVDAVVRPGKKAKRSASRQASLNTVLAAVEERATIQGCGAMDASVGCAPTTVEDCLKASSFGVIRKVPLPAMWHQDTISFSCLMIEPCEACRSSASLATPSGQGCV